MSRKATWVLLVLFVFTRVPMFWLAVRPDIYEHDGIVTASDVSLYEQWSGQMIDESFGAYSEVRIEYPPGSLPFMLAPQVLNGDNSYLVAFALTMVAIDIAGFFGVLVMARRWGSKLGPLVWILAVVALGPIAYARLDLVPAVATIWALERGSAHDWLGAGGWMGVGAIAKLYPLLFIPAGVVLAIRKKKFIGAAAGVFVAPLVPLIASISAVASSVLGYHGDRGIQVESLWGAILFVAQRSGADAGIAYSFGALHFDGPLADTLKPVAAIASIVGLIVGTALAWRIKARREPSRAFAEVCFVVLALSLTTGSVFSPQFLLWLIAIGASLACMEDSRLRIFAIALVPVAAMTQALFPFLYTELLAAGTLPVTILWVRNLAVVAMALGGVFVLWRSYGREVSVPSIPEPVSG